MKSYEIVDVEQGSASWHALRKRKITATDAVIIMRESPWKTPANLYYEKISDSPPGIPNQRMQRGLDLEPIARDLFISQKGFIIQPAVVVKDWAMASLDGISAALTVIVEIKCPGARDHSLAMDGIVPDHYRAQLQHQMYVTGLPETYYFSFDGKNGIALNVKRDDEYIERMVIEEKKFYENLMLRIPPEKEGAA